MSAYARMKQLAFRVPEEHYEEIEAYADKNDVSLSEAAREYIERGVEYADIRNENERLRNRDQQLAKRYEERREEDVNELVEYARRQREKEQAGWVTRQKWRLFGRGGE